MTVLIRSAALFLSLVLSCPAKQGEFRVNLRLLAFSSDLSVANAYLHDPDGSADGQGTKVAVKDYLNREGHVVTLAGHKVVLTTKLEHASITADDEVIGEVSMHDGASSVILFFLPKEPDSKTRCKILGIDDSKQAFPEGSLNILNLCPLPVRLILETEQYEFESYESMIVEDPPVRENQHSGMQAFASKDNEWRQIASGLWPKPTRGRFRQVFFMNPGSNQIQLCAFDDVPPRDPQHEATAEP